MIVHVTAVITCDDVSGRWFNCLMYVAVISDTTLLKKTVALRCEQDTDVQQQVDCILARDET